jgi:hypothetical protein
MAFGMADNQTTAALAAEDAALQVVRVLAVLFAGQVLGGQQLLHPLPRLVIDQRLVLALIERPPDRPPTIRWAAGNRPNPLCLVCLKWLRTSR